MTVNEAMLQVAELEAKRMGYIESYRGVLNAENSRFWGDRMKAVMSQKPIIVKTCTYVLPVFDEDITENERRAKIHIDMLWGEPRINICLPDKTFACLTYKDNICSEAQAFGKHGIELALSVKQKIDYLLNKE